jgi:polyferredoxin
MKNKWPRFSLQVFFFLLVALISVNHTLVAAGNTAIPILSSASLCAICPFGGVATFLNFITYGTLAQQIHLSAIVMMGVIFLLSIILGPVFCAYVCPLGSIQEWFGKLGRKLFKKKYNNLILKNLINY